MSCLFGVEAKFQKNKAFFSSLQDLKVEGPQNISSKYETLKFNFQIKGMSSQYVRSLMLDIVSTKISAPRSMLILNVRTKNVKTKTLLKDTENNADMDQYAPF